MTIEVIQFRLINMGCCGHQLCWVNPRFPSYCPNCGFRVYPDVKAWVVAIDRNAFLTLDLED